MLEQLKKDLIVAMKNKEVVKRDILRFIISQIKNKSIDTGKEVTDDEIIKIMKKEMKQIDETISWLQVVHDDDWLKIEEEKKTVLANYLPEMVSEDELRSRILILINDQEIEDPKRQRWQIIGPIMKEFGSRADWGMINDIINWL